MSQNRPPIPKAIQRAVLIEAGHRCAIHTCRYTNVEIHHICPWEQCQEHRFENLIALCPNCHDRADKGEIDRKSLLFYKARLMSLFDADLGLPKGADASKSHELREDLDDTYHVQAEYPEFDSVDDSVDELNALIRAEAISFIQACRKSAHLDGKFSPILDESERADLREFDIENENFDYMFYEIVHFGDNLLSIRNTCSTYRAGAAHPNHVASTFNYQIKPTFKFELEDICDDSDALASALSEFCINEIKRQVTHDTDAAGDDNEFVFTDWIENGAGPEPTKFKSFSLTTDSLIITFSPYSVAPYAFGFIHVKIPWRDLAKAVSLREPFRTLASNATTSAVPKSDKKSKRSKKSEQAK
ncbi:MAG: DUF3298 domain-containing protein [Candidatus Melainabacteria bacterium]|nr:DUF3298 domain-containing protein [Candidatus Melainabacteria bacterium]